MFADGFFYAERISGKERVEEKGKPLEIYTKKVGINAILIFSVNFFDKIKQSAKRYKTYCGILYTLMVEIC